MDTPLVNPLQLTPTSFAEDGYLVLRGVISEGECDRVRRMVVGSLAPLVGPAEFEADVGYPGAPGARSEPGGQTPRRLLHAYARHECLRDLAQCEAVVDEISRLLPRVDVDDAVMLSQCHHNCVMTKHPGFSSATAWHQDIRYWSFDQPELVTAWFALDAEHRKNGALKIIPGSHKLALDRGRLDRDLFLRTELAENKALIRQARTVDLDKGDVLLFSSQVFHAAGKNLTGEVKTSPVFTYHAASNQPIPQTRSARFPSIAVG